MYNISNYFSVDHIGKIAIFKTNKMKFLKIKMIFFISVFVSCTESNNFKNNGVVVTRHYLASDVGAKILKEGGNAFDSACLLYTSDAADE